MAKSALKDLKANGMEHGLEEIFVEYVNKARSIIQDKYTTEDEIDSEVSLSMHNMLNQFDQYRTRRK